MATKEEIYACFGEGQSLAQWARAGGFSPTTVYNHIARYADIVSWPRSSVALAVEAKFFKDFGKTICRQNSKLMRLIKEYEQTHQEELP